jgi:hypothetical protein
MLNVTTVTVRGDEPGVAKDGEVTGDLGLDHDLHCELVDRRGGVGLLVRINPIVTIFAVPSFRSTDEADFLADIPQWRRCHASIRSRQDVLGGDERQLHE